MERSVKHPTGGLKSAQRRQPHPKSRCETASQNQNQAENPHTKWVQQE